MGALLVAWICLEAGGFSFVISLKGKEWGWVCTLQGTASNVARRSCGGRSRKNLGKFIFLPLRRTSTSGTYRTHP